MLQALESLGGKAELREDQGEVFVTGLGPRPLSGIVDVRSNGTLLRFLVGGITALGGEVSIVGNSQIEGRPLGSVLPLAESLGARFSFAKKPGHVPFHLQAPGIPSQGSHRRGTAIVVDARTGTQGASGLLIGLAARGEPARLSCRTSKGDTHPYVLLTVQALKSLGWPPIGSEGGELFLSSGRPRSLTAGVKPKALWIPKDPSALAFALVTAAIHSQEIFLPKAAHGEVHPDMSVLQNLQALGHEVCFSREGLFFRGRGPGKGNLHYEDLDLRPDSFPPLALLCVFREGEHELGDAPRLRIKESDRVQTLAEGFRTLGIPVQERPGGLWIQGGRLVPKKGRVRLNPNGDHRMAMVFLLLGKLGGLDVQVPGKECVEKSWVAFEEFLKEIPS